MLGTAGNSLFAEIAEEDGKRGRGVRRYIGYRHHGERGRLDEARIANRGKRDR